MSYNLNSWPRLEWTQWSSTAETLHMYLQIVGKTRLALTPLQNHWWNVPLYLTARGLWTSPMLIEDGQSLDIEVDFLSHALIFRTSDGEERTLPLKPMTVKSFFAEYLQLLGDLRVDVQLDPLPVEIVAPIPFHEDDQHRSYDQEAVTRFWHALRLTDFLLKRFSSTFFGKISPVHFFWGAMDLAATRFSGRKAPPRSDGDPVQAEAYSHEVISAGFWPGNGGYGQAAFYAYAAPVPSGLSDAIIPGPGAYNPSLGEFILNYADVVSASQPAEVITRFLEQTYAAAANAASWDRTNLDRT